MSEVDSQLVPDTAPTPAPQASPAPIGTDSHNVIHAPNIGAVALPKSIPQRMQESTLGHLYSLWDKATAAVSNTLGFSKTANTNTPAAPAPAEPQSTAALTYNQPQPVSPVSHAIISVPAVGMVGFPKSVPMPMIESTLGHLYARLTGAPPILSDAAAAI